jgi:hypothetical protein
MGEIMRLTEVEDVSLLVTLKPGESPLVVTVYDKPFHGMTWDETAQRLVEPMEVPKGYFAYGTPTDPSLKPLRADGLLGYYETDDSRHLADITERTQATRVVMAHIYEEVW